ncbi:MAG TPA: uroporphyrinogen-III synthase, partial [Bacillota bacterium]|nr:uroporphyrinogen-III synthase [Bacillota bacterium]
SRKMVAQAPQYDYLVFTSATAVEIFFETLFKMGEDWRYLGHTKVAVIGKKTGRALWMKGHKPDLTAASASSKGLLDTLLANVNKAERIGLYRARQVLPDLAAGLSGAGIKFDDFALYDLLCPAYPAELVRKIFEYPLEIIVLTSPLGVTNFFRVIGDSGIEIDSRTRFACLGPEAAVELQKYDFQPWLTIQKPNIDELVKQVVQRLSKK